MHAICRIAVALLLIFSVSSAGMAYSVSFSGEAVPAELRWKAAGAIPIAVSASLLNESSNIKSDSDVAGAVRRSLETWEKFADIKFQRTDSEKQSVSPSGPSGDGVSLITVAQTPENALLFAKDPERVAATTRVFYNGRGVITEADIVLNPYQQFSTDGTPGTFDLESALTHEIGHLLGLDHSSLLSSTMHLNYGKNGTYGIQNVAARTLSAEDIAAVRAIYGTPAGEAECCGGVSGKLTLDNGRPARNVNIWIEDSEGRVYGQRLTSPDGSFRFVGLSSGNYSVYSESTGRSKELSPVQKIGAVSVEFGETATLTGRIEAGARDLEISYLGFNGQLSDLAVPLNAGRSHRVYLGGKNLDAKRTAISFNSPYLTATPDSATAHDYGEGLTVISFEVRVDPRTPSGEYTIMAESENGGKVAVPGGLTIDESASPMLSLAVPSN